MTSLENWEQGWKFLPPGLSQKSLAAVETDYAGCLFRSRLEARWAVFFDQMGIAWQYEVQGFHCPWRVGKLKGAAGLEDWDAESKETFSYLPDFWLPELGLHAEVKGSLPDPRQLLNAAAALSSDGADMGCYGFDDGGTLDLRGTGHDVVVLGPVYRELSRVPYRLHLHGEALVVVPTHLGTYSRDRDCLKDAMYVARVADNTGHTELPRLVDLYSIERELLGGTRSKTEVGYRYSAAIEAARMARFEHGQNGAIPRPRGGLGDYGSDPNAWKTAFNR